MYLKHSRNRAQVTDAVCGLDQAEISKRIDSIARAILAVRKDAMWLEGAGGEVSDKATNLKSSLDQVLGYLTKLTKTGSKS